MVETARWLSLVAACLVVFLVLVLLAWLAIRGD